MDLSPPLVAWLHEARAQAIARSALLRQHIAAAQDVPAFRERLKDYLQETREQVAALETCLESFGPAAEPRASRTAVPVSADASQGENLVESALASYALAHLALGRYVALIAVAEEAGLEHVVAAARPMLATEEAMARWLGTQLPTLARWQLHRAETEGAR